MSEFDKPTAFDKPVDPNRTRNNIFIIAGTVVVVATYLYLILVQPAAVGDGVASGGTPALITLGGYVLGALLIAIGAINRLPTTTVVLVPVAIAINIVVGQLTSLLGLPIYLDSIGTILVAVVAGPAAGAVTGGLSNVIWGLTLSPLALPFAIVAIVIGAVAGWAARIGVFRSYWAPPIAGLITGIIAALASSPISAFIFGGATGGGTGAIVQAFQAFGNTLLGATTLQGLISDPLDKLITFTVVMLILLALPTRFKQRFPFVRQYNVLPGMKKKDKAAA
jgi:energy-coupling factor transport system substrate-specific component